jgi:hypothetical protein
MTIKSQFVIALENPSANHNIHSLLCALALENPADDYTINMYAAQLPWRIQPTTIKYRKSM